MEGNEQPDLTTWKEIAERLQVTVRTAQAWEKQRGLPVRRLPGGRGRVYMRVSELDAWLDNQPTGDASASTTWRPRPALLSIALVILLLGAATLAWILYEPSGPPALWEVTATSLIIRDEDGRELWEVTFGQGLSPEKYEKPEAQPQFVDLDGDGRLETLFVLAGMDRSIGDVLVCLSPDGTELWRFTPGRPVTSGKERFANVYRIGTFDIVDLAAGRIAIVISGIHYLMYPTQIALLSPADGSIIREYWHAGHIGHRKELMKLADYNQDGRSEIFLGGISNARNRATLVVLDPETMEGVSVEENEDYRLDRPDGFAPGRELARVLFPRSAMDEYFEDFNAGHEILLTPELITVAVKESFLEPSNPLVLYHLNLDFSLSHASTATSFEAVHQRLIREGVLEISLEDEERRLQFVDYVGRPTPLVPAQ